jgi:hypothetical protein
MIREIGDEIVLLDTELDQIHQLNATASFVWRMWNATASAEQIAVALGQAFDVGPDIALRDVRETLRRLEAIEADRVS